MIPHRPVGPQQRRIAAILLGGVLLLSSCASLSAPDRTSTATIEAVRAAFATLDTANFATVNARSAARITSTEATDQPAERPMDATPTISISSTVPPIASGTAASTVATPSVAPTRAVTVPIPTPTILPLPPQPSASPPAAPLTGVQIRAQYETVDVRALQQDPARYAGRKVRVEGVVAAITRGASGTVLQIRVNADNADNAVPPSSVTIAAAVFAALPDIEENDRVAAYGVIDRDLARVRGALGVPVTSPLLALDYIDAF